MNKPDANLRIHEIIDPPTEDKGMAAGCPKVQTRSNVFETNSSSSHSLTLSKDDLVPQTFDKKTLRNGVVDIELGDYNWEWRRYHDVKNKLRYLITQLTDGKLPEGDDPQALTETLIERNEQFRLLSDVVHKHTGCELRVLPSDGGIDHQSARGDAAVGMELFDSAQRLQAFLFNENAYVETGNDNNSAPWSISTDRGSKLYYEDHYGQTPSDPSPIKLTRLRHSLDELATSEGGILSPSTTPDLLKDLMAEGVAISAHWTFDKTSSYRPEGDLRGKAASELIDKGHGFKVSPSMITTSSREAGIDHLEVLSFVVQVSPALAQKIKALDPNGHRNHQIAEAQTELEFWKTRQREEPTDRWSNKQVTKFEDTLKKLGLKLPPKRGKSAGSSAGLSDGPSEQAKATKAKKVANAAIKKAKEAKASAKPSGVA